MRQFTCRRAADVSDALSAIAQPESKFLGGGTNLVDLMKMGVERPGRLIDITPTASTGSAVHAACRALREKLFQLATNDTRSPLHGRAVQDLALEGDRLVVRGTSRGEKLQTLFARHGQKFLEARAGLSLVARRTAIRCTRLERNSPKCAWMRC